MANFVAYYRVSTARQGKSGLGLEAQRAAVREHLNGGTWQVVAEFTEIESGKNADRPKLAAALKECRLRRAKLIIAKLDRLARNVAFVSNLMESGVEFEAVDFPQANRLTIHIMAAIAEHEAKMISDRTKAALAAARRRGVKLGGYRGYQPTAKDRAAGQAAIRERVQASGCTSLRAIAAGLEARGIPAARGGKWTAVQVSRLLEVAAIPFFDASAAVAA
jgi:DNA invertase Pin-like site-specific DNA recombinase